VAFGTDVLATADGDNVVLLRDPRNGEVRKRLRGHASPVTALAFSPDGKILVSTAEDRTIRLWDPATGSARGVLNVSRDLRDPNVRPNHAWLAFHPRGRYLLAGAGFRSSYGISGVSPTILWDLEESAVAALGYASSFAGDFLPDGSGALLADGGGVRLTRLDEMQTARKKAIGKSKATTRPEAVRLDLRTTIVPGQMHQASVWGVAASPDGRWIATAGHDTTVKVWDANTGKLIHTLVGHSGLVWCVAFSPDSKLLASGSGEVKLWDVAGGREVHSFAEEERLIVGLAFHPSGSWIASSTLGGKVRLWDIKARKPLGLLHDFTRAVHQLAFRPDGRWLAAACDDHRVALWEFDEATPPLSPCPPDKLLEGHTTAVWAVTFSADGRYLASGADEGMVQLWDGDTFSRIVALQSEVGQVRCLSFSRDGGLLAAAGMFGTATNMGNYLIVWNLERLHGTLREMGLDW
jgi:WD40 repeat protein